MYETFSFSRPAIASQIDEYPIKSNIRAPRQPASVVGRLAPSTWTILGSKLRASSSLITA